jgi:hypothetical protein
MRVKPLPLSRKVSAREIKLTKNNNAGPHECSKDALALGCSATGSATSSFMDKDIAI